MRELENLRVISYHYETHTFFQNKGEAQERVFTFTYLGK